MYGHREKWRANSIKTIIPEAVPCYQQCCKGVLMHCLHAQSHPPLPTQKSKGGGGVSESLETREALFYWSSAAVKIFSFTGRMQQSEGECQGSPSSGNKQQIITFVHFKDQSSMQNQAHDLSVLITESINTDIVKVLNFHLNCRVRNFEKELFSFPKCDLLNRDVDSNNLSQLCDL